MEEKMVSFFLLKNGKFFHKEDIKEVARIVSNVDQESIGKLSVLRFRSPMLMSLLSFFLGIYGFDRFLLGDIKRGVLKALTAPILFIATILVLNSTTYINNIFFIDDVLVGDQINTFYLTIAMVLFSISALLCIYCIIDIFLIYRDAYKYNYRILVDFAGAGTKRKIITHKESEGVAEEVFYSDVTTPSSSKRNISRSRTTNRRRKTSEDSVVDLENKSKKSRKKR